MKEKKDKKGFVESFLYGRSSSSIAKIPRNRKELFFDIFKYNSIKIFLTSMMVFFFSLPLYLFDFFITLHANFGDINYNPELTNLTYEAFINVRLFSINSFKGLISIPLYMIAFIGLLSGFYIFRKLCFREVVDFFYDLKIAIKKTFKEALVLGFLLGLSQFLLIINLYFFNMDIEIKIILKYFIIFLSIIQFVIVIISCMFAATQSAIYKQPLGGLLKNSFLFSFVSLFKNIGLLLISIVPFILAMVFSEYFVQFIFYLIIGLFYLGFTILLWTLHSHSIFDKYINSKYHPDLVRKGLSDSQ